jgi:ribose-phosphate pyrophosphokinase
MFVVGETEIVFKEFPNGEFLLDHPEDEILRLRVFHELTWIYGGMEDIAKLLVLKAALNPQRLVVSFLPFSRSDKPEPGYSKPVLEVMVDFLARQFAEILVLEPHVSVSAMSDSFLDEPFVLFSIKPVLEGSGCDSVLFPDRGALIRYSTGLDSLEGLHLAIGNKKRDEHGKITEYSVIGPVGENVLIVDDLCCYGGTFIQAAEQLKSAGAKNVDLLVCHLEPAAFEGDLSKYIRKIYCAKTMERPAAPGWVVEMPI